MDLGINKGKKLHHISGLTSSCGPHPKSRPWSQQPVKLYLLTTAFAQMVAGQREGSYYLNLCLLSARQKSTSVRIVVDVRCLS